MEGTTNITKIFCLGDGYAHGHIWPEWPQILQALVPTIDVVAISAIGAGHEFLISELLQQDIRNSLVIFQWPQHNRFDKLLQDQQWYDLTQTDPVYHFNTYKTNHGTWWCSSASKLDAVIHYHNFYIQSQQSILRQNNQKILVESYVKQLADYVCTSNAEQELFATNKRFNEFRGNEIQPAPLLHYHWLIESILPKTTIKIDNMIAQELHRRISSHQWVPYDPDREEIWRSITKQAATPGH